MLSNQEYAAYHQVPVNFDSPLMDEFAAFTIPITTSNGVVDLWEVKKQGKTNASKMAKMDREASKAENLAKYIARGFAFESEVEGEWRDNDSEVENDD